MTPQHKGSNKGTNLMYTLTYFNKYIVLLRLLATIRLEALICIMNYVIFKPEDMRMA